MQMQQMQQMQRLTDREIRALEQEIAYLAWEYACAALEDEETALRVVFDDTSATGKVRH